MKDYLKDYTKLLVAKLRGAAYSLTVWFNALVGLLVAALPDALIALPQMREFIPDNIYGYLSAMLVVGNILIRARTRQALEDKKNAS